MYCAKRDIGATHGPSENAHERPTGFVPRA